MEPVFTNIRHQRGMRRFTLRGQAKVRTQWRRSLAVCKTLPHRYLISVPFEHEAKASNGGADFYGKNPKVLRTKFKKSLHVFLEVCKKRGLEPRRSFSGKFNLRIPPALHEKLAIEAQAQGKSINALAQEALQERGTCQ